jgi:hypothetical protein
VPSQYRSRAFIQIRCPSIQGTMPKRRSPLNRSRRASTLVLFLAILIGTACTSAQPHTGSVGPTSTVRPPSSPTPPTQTVSPPPFPRSVLLTAQRLYWAWRAGDRAGAASYATEKVIADLFGDSWSTSDLPPHTCHTPTEFSPYYVCGPGLEKDFVDFYVQSVPGGYRVTGLGYCGQTGPSIAKCILSQY